MNQVQQIPFGQPHTPDFALIPILLIVALIGAASFLIIIPAYRRYTGFSYGRSVMLWVCSMGLTLVLLTYISVEPRRNSMEPFFKCAIFTFLLSFLALPFTAQLYRKWIGGHLTDAEKLPGMDGVRAWLGVGNVICAALIPFCIEWAFEPSSPVYQPMTLLWLTFGALLAYPILSTVSQSAQPAPAAPSDDLSNEREKVLQLLEAGKINADESAELLNALGQSVPPRPTPAVETELSPARKLVLLGAALLLLGFFLPWFSINPGAVVNEMAAKFQQGANQLNLSIPGGTFSLPGATVQVHAGDVAHGLGWWILALGIGAAVLPFFATTLTAFMRKKVMLAALGVGAVLLIYLLSNSLRFTSIGVVLALAGYALEVVGTLKERPVAR